MSKVLDAILFYSRHSKNCLPILNVIEQYKIPIHLISVDSKEVRDYVSNENFKLKVVPTILLIFNDGNTNVYEGMDAHHWMRDQIQKMMPSQPSRDEKKPKKKPAKKSVKKKVPKEDYLEIIPIEEEEHIEKPTRRKGEKKGTNKPTTNIMDVARQMELERKRTLGYKTMEEE